jgi:hypothetical protein
MASSLGIYPKLYGILTDEHVATPPGPADFIEMVPV